jgi:two-component system, sensor histidine kinase and response regulator
MTKETKLNLVGLTPDRGRSMRHGLAGSSVFGLGAGSRHRALAELRLMAIDLLLLADEATNVVVHDAEARALNSGPFQLADTIEDVVAILMPRAAAKGLDLCSRIDPAVPNRLLGDPDRLSQILLNLAGSAVRFIHDGRIFVDVEIARRWADRVELRFQVTDVDAEIDIDALSVLALEFAQLDGTEARRYGGAGLGIVSSNRLVQLMGGRMMVDNTSDLGGIFSFTLPLALDGAAQQAG